MFAPAWIDSAAMVRLGLDVPVLGNTPGANEGALIGRVGSGGTPFLVGDLAEVPPGETGELQLCINDDLEGRYGIGLGDNQGALTVQVGFGTA